MEQPGDGRAEADGITPAGVGQPLADLPDAEARVVEDALDVGLRAAEDRLGDEGPQVEAAQALAGDLGRQLGGRRPPQLGRVVEQEALGNQPTVPAQGEGLEGPGRTAVGQQSRPQHLDRRAPETDGAEMGEELGRRQREADEAAFVPDLARHVDAPQIVTEQPLHLGGDLRVAVVQTVRPGVVAEVAGLQGRAVAADPSTGLVEREGKAAPTRRPPDREPRRSPAEHEQMGRWRHRAAL